MIRVGKTLAAGLLAVAALTQAVHADVTRSDRNDPRGSIAGEMGMLLSSEKSRLNTLSGETLGAIALGPMVSAKAAPLATKPARSQREPAAQKKTARTAEAVVIPASARPFGADLRHEAGWLMAQPAPEGGADWQCLTEAIYFESRGESLQGQFAVAEVILNRRDSGLYPRSVCGVVRQQGNGGCQFSYVCDGSSNKMRDRAARDMAGRIARVMLDGAPRQLTAGATHFHTRSVSPGWSKSFARTAAIGSHLFYRQPGTRG